MKFHKLGMLIALILTVLSVVPAFADDDSQSAAVYAMTNADDGNEVLMYERGADGRLALVDAFATGGMGLTTEPDDALGSQNPLIISQDGRWLFAVNAGSNTIASFKVKKKELKLVDVMPSGGDFPASLTLHGDLLYVLNAGGNGNITGFRLRPNGRLQPLEGSTRSLNAGGSNPPFFLDSPAQLGFTPAGDKLVISVKSAVAAAPKFHLFAMDSNGLPSAQPVTSAARVPFGFVFDAHSNLIVAEPFGADFPPPGTKGVAGSYQIVADGSLVEISTPVGNNQTATCWIAITPDGRFAYTTNNGSASISSYSVAADGSLTKLNDVAATSGAHPVDLAITPDGAYMYNVNAADGTVSMYQINSADGTLTSLGTIGGLPVDGSAVGIAAR